MKKVLITGGNSGLGFEIAKELLRKDYHVTILGKSRQGLKEAEKTLHSKNLDSITCDLRKYEDIKKSLKEIRHIDILINNAGIIAYKNLDKQSSKNIEDIIKTNLLGTIYVTRQLLPLFKKQNSGTIMNVSSTSGLVTGGYPGECAYAVSKFGVTGFTETLKKELGDEDYKIRVLGFYPGGMNTPLFSKSGSDKDASCFMDPKEIAKIVMFILERPEGIKMDHVIVNRNKFV